MLAEAELKASRITSDAESEARTRRDQIIAEAMEEAASIRSAATEEVAGFLRRLDDERAQLLETAREEAARVVSDARAASATDAARMRDATEQELEVKARGILDAANEESRQIIERATAEAGGKRNEGGGDLGPRAHAAPEVPSEPRAPKTTKVTTNPATPTSPSESPESVRWHADSGATTTTVDAPEPKPSNGVLTNGSVEERHLEEGRTRPGRAHRRHRRRGGHGAQAQAPLGLLRTRQVAGSGVPATAPR